MSGRNTRPGVLLIHATHWSVTLYETAGVGRHCYGYAAVLAECLAASLGPDHGPLALKIQCMPVGACLPGAASVFHRRPPGAIVPVARGSRVAVENIRVIIVFLSFFCWLCVRAAGSEPGYAARG